MGPCIILFMVKKRVWNRKVIAGLVLILVSHLGWIVPALVVLLWEVSVQVKGVVIAGGVIFGNITFNLGLVFVGANLFKRLKSKNLNLKLVWNQVGVFVGVVRKRIKSSKY